MKSFSSYYRYFHVYHIFFIIAIALIVLWKIALFSFQIGWDDSTYVLNHYTENGWSTENIRSILTEFYMGQYAPVNQIHYTTLFEFFDYNPMSFHIASILIHLINVILVYLFVYTIGNHIYNYSLLKKAQISFLTALFFSIGPINLEPIAWVAASKVLLYALFYLLAMICYLSYITKGLSKYYYTTLLLFLLSFGAKEQAVSLPIFMFLIDFIYKRDFGRRVLYLEKMPMLALALLFSLASFQSLGAELKIDNNFYSILDRIPLAVFTIVEYFTKILIPVNLSYAYPFPFHVKDHAPIWMWSYLAIVLLTIYCFLPSIKRVGVIFGFGFFLIHILLVSNLINLSRYSFVADRYAYMSSIGVYFLLASATMSAVNYRIWRKPTLILLFVMTCYYGAYTSYHSLVWENSVTLKEKMRINIQSREDYESWKRAKDNGTKTESK